MQFTLATAFAAFALGANALSFKGEGFTKIARQDPHYGDIRVFGELGCSADNLGVWTVLQSDSNICHDFSETILSLELIDQDSAANGCTFFAYSEAGCAGIRRAFGTVAESGCGDATAGVDSWGSFMFFCPAPGQGN